MQEVNSINQVYVALGSNIGDSFKQIRSALHLISQNPDITALTWSNLYLTTPVYQKQQNNYLNAVCRFNTSLEVTNLLAMLQSIERALGKVPAPKNFPRLIDLNILFYGTQRHSYHSLEIPHPFWQERLFVLKPLADLIENLPYLGDQFIDLKKMLVEFSNPHNEKVTLYDRQIDVLS